MQAIQFDDGRIEFRKDAQLQEPAAGDVIVDVQIAGICETDLQLAQGYMGFSGIPGHEFVGVPRSGKFQGKRVVCEINCACHNCNACVRKRFGHCPNRTVIGILNHDGAFAEQIVVPERNLHLVPPGMSNDVAVFTEPAAAACQLVEQISVLTEDKVVILGDGRLGNLCAQVMMLLSENVMVVGRHDAKLAALRALQIQATNRSETSPDRSADIVIDCTGSESGLADAMQWVRPLGTIVMKTTIANPHSLNLSPIVIDEITLIGSRCGPFPRALKWLQGGNISVAGMISARCQLSDARRAFELATQPESLKVVFDIAPSDNVGS